MIEKMRFLVPVFLVVGVAVVHADPLSLDAKVKSSSLELTFRNTTKSKLTIPISSDGWDDRLTVTLTQAGKTRAFHFGEPMDKYIERTADLAAGGTRVESIDLVSWALRGNTDPPVPGDYEVTATWDNRKGTTEPKIVVSAKPMTRLTA